MHLFRALLMIQSVYTLITAIWPIVHIESFMAVTGPKEDIWLVKTVGALLIPVGLCLLLFRHIRMDPRPAILLGGGTAVAFIIIDFYYALTDVIWNIYMVDGFLQLVFLVLWIRIALTYFNGEGDWALSKEPQ